MFVYINIPFCRQRCSYCKFIVVPSPNPAALAHYTTLLLEEMERSLVGGEWPLDEPIESIYLGGGTPSLLDIPTLRLIFEKLQKNRPMARECEVCIECHPEDVSQEYVDGLLSLGVTRISLGIETLDPWTLIQVGRPDIETCRRALRVVRDSGVASWGIDFITGLPRCGEILDEVREIVEVYDPPHMSVYMLESGRYSVDYGTPDEYEERAMREYTRTVEYLRAHDYDHYELSNLARTGHHSRHNAAYWTHRSYRGYGASAASYVGGARWTNSSSLSGYARGEIRDHEVLTSEDIRTEQILFGLRTFSLKKSLVGDGSVVDSLVKDGMLGVQNDTIFPTLT